VQPRVTAIVVARRGGDALRATLDALAGQSRRPDLLVVVDAADDDATTSQLAAVNPTQFVTASSSLPFGELVHRGLGALPAMEQSSSPYGGIDEWLWLLRHDTEPDSRALEHLLAAVEIAPSVAAAGPKQLDASQPTVIAEYGETLTRWGASMAIAERELDQAQHDRTADVLAMGEAGLLVRRSVWNAVEGIDPAMPPVDAALDLCVRIRLAGHRVIGVPRARVFVHESAPLAAKPGTAPRPLSARALARQRRTAQLYRRLVYAPAATVPLHWLSLLPLAILRSLGHLLRKRPGYVAGELRAALAVAFSATAVPAARRRLARGRTMGWAAIDPLRMAPDEVARRRSIARDAELSAREDNRSPRPSFLPGGALVVGLSALLGGVMFAPLVGAPALLGGALAPLAPDAATLLSALERAQVAGGGTAATDPFAFVLAALGVLSPWHPSASLVALWLAALPLAALGGWWAAASLVQRPGPAAAVATLWALSPSLLVSLAEGRPAAVTVHLALPWLVVAAVRAPRSWSATAVAGLLAAIIAASAPSLVPALVVAWILGMLIRPRSAGRLLTLVVPSLALWLPLVVDQVRRGTPIGLLADPGLAAAPGHDSPTGLLLGWPDLTLLLQAVHALVPALEQADTAAPLPIIALVLAALAVPVVALALGALALPHGRRAIAPLLLAALGLVTAWSISGIAVSVANGVVVGLDVAPALSLAALGMALAAGLGIQSFAAAGRVSIGGPVRPGAGARAIRATGATLTALAIISSLVLALPALTAVVRDAASVRAGEARTLPAIVAAEAADAPALGTLVLTPVAVENGTAVAARVERGAGRTLIEQRTLVTTTVLDDSDDAWAQSVAELVANLAAPSGLDVLPLLDELDVAFVLLAPADAGVPGSASDQVVAALDGTTALTPVGDADAGRLWRVAGGEGDGEGSGDDAIVEGEPATGQVAGARTVLAVQLGILALTVLLAVPTTFRARRRDHIITDDEPAATFEPGDDDD